MLFVSDKHLSLVLLASTLAVLPACGTKTGAADVALTGLIDGKAVQRFGFGAEGGEKPALAARAAGGFALAYVGSKSGNRHVYVATSADGRTWSKAAAVAAGDFADANPALAEDAKGSLHLFFASNRSGEDQGLYHVVQTGATWGAATELPGFAGCQDVAACADETGVTIAAEVMGVGLLATASADGTTFAAPTELSAQGAEPAATPLGGGRSLVAFQRDGQIWGKAGRPGAWEAEKPLASGETRLRDPALGAGQLIWSMKGETAFGLHASAIDENQATSALNDPITGAGDARGPAIAQDHNGATLLAWGTKNANGQQGVVVTTR